MSESHGQALLTRQDDFLPCRKQTQADQSSSWLRMSKLCSIFRWRISLTSDVPRAGHRGKLDGLISGLASDNFAADILTERDRCYGFLKFEEAAQNGQP